MLIEIPALLRDWEDGGIARLLSIEGLSEIIGSRELAKADEVLAAPTLPYQFQEALLEDIVEGGFSGRHPYSALTALSSWLPSSPLRTLASAFISRASA